MAISIRHNPFATRFVRPGVVPFLLPDGDSLESIVDRFRENGFLGQIIGPHGSGKTTLTHALGRFLIDDFHRIRRITFRDAKYLETDEPATSTHGDPKKQLLVIDGLEKLTWSHRRLLLKHVRDRQIGLLMTSHRPIGGIPLLHEVKPTLATFQRLTDMVAPGLSIQTNVLAETFERNNQDIRESLMALYNWFEAERATTGMQDGG